MHNKKNAAETTYEGRDPRRVYLTSKQYAKMFQNDFREAEAECEQILWFQNSDIVGSRAGEKRRKCCSLGIDGLIYTYSNDSIALH